MSYFVVVTNCIQPVPTLSSYVVDLEVSECSFVLMKLVWLVCSIWGLNLFIKMLSLSGAASTGKALSTSLRTSVQFPGPVQKWKGTSSAVLLSGLHMCAVAEPAPPPYNKSSWSSRAGPQRLAGLGQLLAFTSAHSHTNKWKLGTVRLTWIICFCDVVVSVHGSGCVSSSPLPLAIALTLLFSDCLHFSPGECSVLTLGFSSDLSSSRLNVVATSPPSPFLCRPIISSTQQLV